MKLLLFCVFLFVVSTTELVDVFELETPNSDRSLPVIHPFDSETELKEAVLNDPLGFSTKHFIHSHQDYHSLKAANVEHHTFARSIKNSHEKNHKSGHKTTLNYEGAIFHGTINLDHEKDNIISLSCQKSDEVTITTKDRSLLDSIIPGTRLHVGFMYEKNCPGNIFSRYNLVKGRKNYILQDSTMTLTFIVKPLSLPEMFHTLDVKIHHDKPTDENSVRRQEIDKRSSFMFFPFNYDRDTQSAVKSTISLYEVGYQKITCENCYAYLDSGIILHIITSWLSVDTFKLGIYGQTEANFELKYNFQYHFDKTFEKQLYFHKFPSVKFMIGSIPLILAPAIQLDVGMHATIDAALTVSSAFYFKEYAEMSVNYNKGGSIYMDKVVNKPTIEYKLPHIEESSNGRVRAEAGVYPKVMLYVYAIAPVKLTGIPKVFFEGDVDKHKLTYNTYYSIDMQLGLDPLEVPKEIPSIGGKTYDFEGRLPWGKTWNFVNHEEIKCKYCKGEVEF